MESLRIGKPAGTRWRVLDLLRRSAHTVGELAAALELTPNAVRLHLAALERDGLVERHGTQREWTGKPALVYRPTAAATTAFAAAHDAVLNELLKVLGERSDPVVLESLLRETGARLGSRASLKGEDLRGRVEHAAAVLNELGGVAEVQEEPGGFRLQGYSCPLGALTREHPLTCRLAESLVAELTGAVVSECCERGERPRCAFRIRPSDSGGGAAVASVADRP